MHQNPRCFRNSTAYVLRWSHFWFSHCHTMEWGSDVFGASLFSLKRELVLWRVLAAFGRVTIPAREPLSAWLDGRLQWVTILLKAGLENPSEIMYFQLLFLVFESDNVSYVHLHVFISLTCNQCDVPRPFVVLEKAFTWQNIYIES